MVYLDLAKCSLLEQVYRSSIGLPLWQSVTVLTLFLGSTLIGVLLAVWHRRVTGICRSLWRASIAIALLAALVAVCTIMIGGIQYLFFLLRMSKDSLFCAYFEGSRFLTATQIGILGAIVLINIGLVISHGLDHLGSRPSRRTSAIHAISWAISSVIVCVAYGMSFAFTG